MQKLFSLKVLQIVLNQKNDQTGCYHSIYRVSHKNVCIHIKKNCKRSVLLKFYFKCVKIFRNDSLLFFSLPVLKLMPILIQTLLKTPSNEITHIMKQFPWYLSTFMFDGFSQISDYCKFCSIDFVF